MMGMAVKRGMKYYYVHTSSSHVFKFDVQHVIHIHRGEAMCILSQSANVTASSIPERALVFCKNERWNKTSPNHRCHTACGAVHLQNQDLVRGAS